MHAFQTVQRFYMFFYKCENFSNPTIIKLADKFPLIFQRFNRRP